MSVMSRRRTLAAIALGALFASLSTPTAAMELQMKRKKGTKQAEQAKTPKVQNSEQGIQSLISAPKADRLEQQNAKLRNLTNEQ